MYLLANFKQRKVLLKELPKLEKEDIILAAEKIINIDSRSRIKPLGAGWSWGREAVAPSAQLLLPFAPPGSPSAQLPSFPYPVPAGE